MNNEYLLNGNGNGSLNLNEVREYNNDVETDKIQAKTKARIKDLHYGQLILKGYMEYARNTGDYSYEEVISAFKTINKKQEQKQEAITIEEAVIDQDVLRKEEENIAQVCMIMGNLLDELVKEKLEKINHQGQGLRNMLEGVVMGTKDNEKPYLITELEEQHRKLAFILSNVARIAKKYQHHNKKIFKALNDLDFFLTYIQHDIQPTQIEAYLSRPMSDPYCYIRRLKNYLEQISPTTYNLINAIVDEIED